MFYHELWDNRFQVKKGKWVFVQSEVSKARGREIVEHVYKKWLIPRYFYHLSYGHVEALKYHLDHKFFASIDITNFFGSINRSRVTRVLKSLFDYTTARDYAKDSVVTIPESRGKKLQYMLPFGFTQSPLLASLCIEKSMLGRILKKIDANPRLKVSVYVDDIIISSNDIEELNKAFDELITATKRSRWEVSGAKKQPPSDSITVFNIHASYRELWITEERLNEFIDAYRNSTSDSVKEGIVSYIRSVNPAQVATIY